jgi:copper chaperone
VISKNYSVPDVSCGHCKATIEKVLGALPGVASVAVEVEAKTVDVSFDEQVISETEVLSILEQEGYPVAA